MDAIKLTPRQLEAVWAWMIYKDHKRRADGSYGRGNALRQMISAMAGLGQWGEYDRYDKDRPAIFNSGPMVPALRAFLDDPRAEKFPAVPGEPVRERIEARITALEAAHAEWSVELERRTAAQQEAARLQNATDRANRIGRHRDNLRELGKRFNIKELSMFADSDDDDVILAFATSVCDAEFSS